MVSRTPWAWTLPALALIVAALLAFAPKPAPPTDAQSAQAQAAQKVLEAALEALESGQTEAEAEDIASEPGLLPSAMSCGMRRPSVLPSVARDIRTRFALAAFSNDPEVKGAFLDRLSRSEDPEVRIQALLTLARLALRRERPDEAVAHAEAARKVEDLPPGCLADTWVIAALATDRPTDREAALAEAIRLDPGSWAAQLSMAATLARLLDTPSSPGVCARRAKTLIKTIVALDMLAGSDEQLARLERTFAPGADADAVSAPGRTLVLGMVRERSARDQEAARAYRTGLTAAVAAGSCGALLKTALSRRLQALESRPKDAEDTPQ